MQERGKYRLLETANICTENRLYRLFLSAKCRIDRKRLISQLIDNYKPAAQQKLHFKVKKKLINNCKIYSVLFLLVKQIYDSLHSNIQKKFSYHLTGFHISVTMDDPVIDLVSFSSLSIFFGASFSGSHQSRFFSYIFLIHGMFLCCIHYHNCYFLFHFIFPFFLIVSFISYMYTVTRLDQNKQNNNNNNNKKVGK